MFSLQQRFYEPTVVCSRELFYETVRSSKVAASIDAARQCYEQGDRKGYDANKRGLPAFIFMSTMTPNTHADRKGQPRPEGLWRCQEAVRLNGLVMIDIDHVDDPHAEFERIPDHWFDETTCRQCIMLVHVTPSGHGLRVVCTADAAKGNLMDNAQVVATAMGWKLDEACKDASRMSFAVKESDILYINDKIFDYDNEAYDQQYGPYYRKGAKPVQQSCSTGNPKENNPENTTDHVPATTEPLSYHGTEVQRIVDCWLVRNGTPAVGDRHRNMLQLAGDLRYILDNNEDLVKRAVRMAPFVRDIEQERGAGEVDSVCTDACGQRMWRDIPKRMQDVLARAGVKAGEPTEATHPAGDADTSVYDTFWRRLEPLLAPPYDVVCTVASDYNKLGAVMAGGAMFCTLMTRCWYRHYDGMPQRMNPQVLIIGDPASGKSFADRLDKEIMAVMRAADEPGREAERRYKKEQKERGTSSKAAKGDALKQPEAIIRYLPSRTSNAVFYRRAINAKEQQANGTLLHLHVYTFDSELDSSITAQSGGSWIGKHDLELKAFHNEWSGVDYANADSVNENIQVFWNTVTTGTPISLGKKITLRNVNDGLCSRVAVFRMMSSGYQMIGRGNYQRNHETELALKEWGYWFDRLQGELRIERLVDHVYDLCEQSAREAEASDDKVLDYLRKRAVFYATWLTIPRVVARLRNSEDAETLSLENLKVTDEDLLFATLMYDAVIYWQDYFFGQMLQDSWDNASQLFVQRRQLRTTRNADQFESLPEEFNTEKVAAMLALGRTAAASQIKRWVKQGWVERVRQGRYRKLKGGAS